MTKELKKEQVEAITSPKSLVVSANAGSGKTFVMIEKVLYYISEKNQSILDFLLITFTDAAANQMQTKMHKELLAKYNETEDKSKKSHIKKQISLLAQADISTIHTFCYKLIKKYFYVINIPQNSSICDDDASKELKEKAMLKTLNHFTKNQSDEFSLLYSCYGSKRNFDILKEIIYDINDFMRVQVDRGAFRKKVLDFYLNDFENSKIEDVINDYVFKVFDYFLGRLKNLLLEAKACGYETLIKNINYAIEKLDAVSKNNTFEQNLSAIVAIFDGIPKNIAKKNEDKALYDLFGEIKSELKDEVGYLKDKILPSSNINTLKQDLLWCGQNIKTLFLVEDFFENEYTNLKRQKNVLDFSDLEHFALRILEDKTIRDEIASMFKHIFVDEYQDVNDLQEAIISKIFDPTKNSLFLVGDPKQSIYGFRNTKPQIMIEKLKSFQTDEKKSVVMLTHNFRSDKNVLRFVDFVFSKIMNTQTSSLDYKKTETFKVGLDDFKSNNLPVVEVCVVNHEPEKRQAMQADKVYSVLEAESVESKDNVYAKTQAYIIASKVSDLINKKYKIFDPSQKENGGMREVRWSDIVVLYRSKDKTLNEIIKTLKEIGIPTKTISGESVIGEYEVQCLVNYLKLLISCDDDFALVGFLTSFLINLSFEELALLREKNEGSIFEILKANKGNKKIDFALSLISEGREKLLNGTIYEVLSWLIEKTKYEIYLRSLPNGENKVLNVKTFVEDFLYHTYNSDLVSYLSYIEENKKVKCLPNSSGESDAISFVTMHKSKGLEYPIVFVVNASQKYSKKDLSGPCLFSEEFGLGIEKFDNEKKYKRSTVLRSAIILDESQKNFGEELRVLYVALTRAKNHLFVLGDTNIQSIVSGSDFCYLKNKNNSLDIILSCLSNSELEAIKQKKSGLKIKTGEDTNFFVSVFEPIEKQDFENTFSNSGIKIENLSKKIFENTKLNQEKLDKQLKKQNIAYKSSVSRILEKEDNKVNTLNEPKKFFISEDGVSADKIGTAYHKAMQIVPLDLSQKSDIENFLKENMDFDEFKLIDCEKITKCVNSLKKYTTNADKIIREGQFYLNIEYNKIITSSDIDEKILIQGIVDFVAIKGEEAILIDFKTNREKNDEKLKEKYKIQLDCYKIAVENALKKKVSRKILYSFFKDCEISFDN